MRRYTYAELNQMRVTKGELFVELKQAGYEFDYSLPQDWLNEFSEFCSKRDLAITYHLIRSTTVWAYGDSIFGNAVTVCDEVYEMLEEFYNRDE